MKSENNVKLHNFLHNFLLNPQFYNIKFYNCVKKITLISETKIPLQLIRLHSSVC